MTKKLMIISAIAALCCGCAQTSEQETIPTLSWAGMPADKADILFPLAKECGFDWHLGLYKSQEMAISAMDAALGGFEQRSAGAGIGNRRKGRA